MYFPFSWDLGLGFRGDLVIVGMDVGPQSYGALLRGYLEASRDLREVGLSCKHPVQGHTGHTGHTGGAGISATLGVGRKAGGLSPGALVLARARRLPPAPGSTSFR